MIEYEKMGVSIFGYLFRGPKIRLLNARVGQTLPCTNALDLHKRLSDLRTVHDSLVVIKQTLTADGLAEEVGEFVYRILLTDSECCSNAPAVRYLLETFA